MTFKYKNITYKIDESYFGETSVNDSSQFHYEQFLYLIEKQDWITLQNRINNYLLHGGLQQC